MSPETALLLRPTCHGMTQLYAVLLGSMHGSRLWPSGWEDDAHVCGSQETAARALAWYSWMAWGLVILGSGFIRLEWRVKSHFVKASTGRCLAYRPLHLLLPGSHCSSRNRSSSSCSSRRQGWLVLSEIANWCLLLPTALGLLWLAVLRLVRHLPAPECQYMCDQLGTCDSLQTCGK